MKKDFRYDATLLSRASFPAVLEAGNRPCIVETTVYRPFLFYIAIFFTSLFPRKQDGRQFFTQKSGRKTKNQIFWHIQDIKSQSRLPNVGIAHIKAPYYQKVRNAYRVAHEKRRRCRRDISL